MTLAVYSGFFGLRSDDLDRLDGGFCFRSCRSPTVDTEVFIQIPARQDEQKTFTGGRSHLTAWAKQERRPKRVELSLPMVCRRAASVGSLSPEYAQGSLRWRSHGQFYEDSDLSVKGYGSLRER